MIFSGRWFWVALAAALLASRAAHLNILWADEDYHLAAAIQLLHGKMLYRDVWYDKPPLNALLMLVFGAWPGWPLRLAGVVLEMAGAAAIGRFATELWGRREGYFAAALFAFFHIFYLPSTAIPLEPDSIMLLPHILAVYWAWRRQAVWAGAAAGVCFLLNPKGLFVLPACLLFYPAGFRGLAAGFLAPVGTAAAWLGLAGALPGYLDQVWRWGWLYAAAPLPDQMPWLRLGNWLGFHGALVLGAMIALRRPGTAQRWQLLGWLLLGVAVAGIGWRWLPRYFQQLFPALVMLGGCGLAQVRARSWLGAVAAVALLVPAARFGPRYAQLLADDFAGRPHDWNDTFMDRESRQTAELVKRVARPGDTIFIWGYRPNLVAYTRLPVSGPLWESQPVTMVPADRHLGSAAPLDAAWARQHQEQLARTQPDILVDGLSAYNPDLDLGNIPLLKDWFRGYCEVGPVGGSVVYRRCPPEP